MHLSFRARSCGAAIAVGLLACTSLGWQLRSRPTEQQQGTLYADLWMQTSAEYQACCLQTYQLAGDQVERELKRIKAEEENLPPASRGLPPAVIMDLDETTIDNGTYETYLYDSGQDFTTENFSRFVSEHRSSIRMVPGAKEFIERMESLGVAVMYNTNRPEALREATIATLEQWGISTKGLDDPATLRLLLETRGPSKEARREAVRAKYRVLALFGDQLIDFSDEFMPPAVKTIEARHGAVLKRRNLFGTQWFVLPNPVYGHWQSFVKDNPSQYLRRAER
jgi:5'-nucleotidase (lipoprotein e(P4) family)